MSYLKFLRKGLWAAILVLAPLAWGQSGLSASEASAAQRAGVNPETLSPEQLAQARSALGGRDPSTLSASELAAAKQALEGAQSRRDTSRVGRDSLKSKGLRAKDTLGVDSLALADSLFTSPVLDTFQRYESWLFSRSMPSAFFDKQGVVSAEYPIKPDDQLVLSLWGAVEKEYPLTVNSQGKVFVEGIGLVSLNNMTLGNAEKVLRSKLTGVYAGIGQGRISVNLRPVSMGSNKVFVLGDVRRPGGYDLPGGSNVFLALYRAQGPNHIGSVRNIKVKRASGDSLVFDLYDLLFRGGRADQAVLRDGDLVFVPRAQALVKVQGDVGRPAIYELKAGEGVREALLFAGGVNPTAGNATALWRLQDDGRFEVSDLGTPREFGPSGRQEPMSDGDSLMVRPSTKETEGTVELVGAVWYPGLYRYTAGMGVKQAVDLAGGLQKDGYADRVVIRRIQADSSFLILADSYANPSGVTLLPKDQLVVLSTKTLRAHKRLRVSGAVKKPMEMEWQPGIHLKNLIALAGGFAVNHQKGRVLVERLKPGSEEVRVIELKINDDLTIEGRDDLVLEPGDRVVVPTDPEFYEQELVSLSGAVRNPGAYALVKTRETVTEFVKRVAQFDENAFLQGGRLYRKRGNAYYQVNFDFKQAVAGKLKKAITLQHGDSIAVPMEQLTVQIKGEVVSPGDVLWVDGWDIDDYVNAAGGLTGTGDEDRIVVTYANGKKSNRDRADDDPDPGSIIEVAYKKPPEPVQWTQVVSAIGTVVTALAAFLIAYATLK